VTAVDGTTPLSATASVERALDRIRRDDRPGIWIERVAPEVVRADAARVDRAAAAGADLPLAGVTLAVKNNLDVRGIRTTAGCPSFGRVADAHAPVVQQLVDAGAVVMGVTNLDQFATGLVGTRSPYGICPNAHWPGLVSGGSSSGSAVAVAAGHVDLALGTDTAGSGRVPAAANGILGVKPTRGRLSTDGLIPACESFDCVSLFARGAALLARALAVVSPAPPAAASRSSVAGLRVALPDPDDLTFDGDAGAAERFARASARLVSSIQARTTAVDLQPFLATGRLLYEGAFVLERYDAVGDFVDAHPDDIDPVVYSIIHAARDIPRAGLERDRLDLDRRRASTAVLWSHADVLLVPTVPRLPTVAEVQAAPIAVNSMLGTYTNFVNLLDLCAISIPVADPDDGDHPPASLMLLAPAGQDELLLDVAALGVRARNE